MVFIKAEYHDCYNQKLKPCFFLILIICTMLHHVIPLNIHFYYTMCRKIYLLNEKIICLTFVSRKASQSNGNGLVMLSLHCTKNTAIPQHHALWENILTNTMFVITQTDLSNEIMNGQRHSS